MARGSGARGTEAWACEPAWAGLARTLTWERFLPSFLAKARLRYRQSQHFASSMKLFKASEPHFARLLVEERSRCFDGGFDLRLLGVPRGRRCRSRLDFRRRCGCALRLGTRAASSTSRRNAGRSRAHWQWRKRRFPFRKAASPEARRSRASLFIGSLHRSRPSAASSLTASGSGSGHRGLRSSVHVHRLVIMKPIWFILVIIELVNASEKLFDLGIQAVNLSAATCSGNIDLVNVVTAAINRRNSGCGCLPEVMAAYSISFGIYPGNPGRPAI